MLGYKINILVIILFIIIAAFFIIAHCWFVNYTRNENYDRMGAPAPFDIPFGLSNLLFWIALTVSGYSKWYISIICFIFMLPMSFVDKWYILDKLLEPFRKPNFLW